MHRSVLLAGLLAALVAVCLPARMVVAQRAPTLLQKVEVQRGQPLTSEQRQQFARTIASLREALLPAQQKFVRSVGHAFNLAAGEVQAMQPAIGVDDIGFDRNIIPQLEARRSRVVTPEELHQIRTADNAKKAEMGEIQARYAGELAGIAGLSKDQIQRILPSIGL